MIPTSADRSVQGLSGRVNLARIDAVDVYIVIFGSIAWARFTSADITS
jgi:hypothetical protein